MRLIFNIEGKSELDNDQMKEVIRNLFTGATYTVRDKDKVIASEPMPVEEILRNMDSFGPLYDAVASAQRAFAHLFSAATLRLPHDSVHLPLDRIRKYRSFLCGDGHVAHKVPSGLVV